MKKIYIKNYSTDKPVHETVAEIQQLLAENGAKGIYFDYGEGGVLRAIIFQIEYSAQTLSFRLPAKVEEAYQALFANMRSDYRFDEQRKIKAAKVAWRVCLLWVQAQLTHVNLKQAEMAEVFLPYLMIDKNKTLFEGMRDTKFQLSAPRENDGEVNSGGV